MLKKTLTSTFNTKSTELESKIKDADIIAKSAVTKELLKQIVLKVI